MSSKEKERKNSNIKDYKCQEGCDLSTTKIAYPITCKGCKKTIFPLGNNIGIIIGLLCIASAAYLT